MEKKLLYVTPWFLPDSNAASVRAESFVNGIESSNINVDVLTSTRSVSRCSATFFKPLGNKYSNLRRLLSEIAYGIELFLRIIFSSYSIVFISTPPYISALFASFACILSSKKYVLDVRDTYPQVYYNLGLLGRGTAIATFLETVTRFVYTKTEFLVTVSEGCVRDIEDILGDKKKVYKLTNGFDSDIFKPAGIKQDVFTAVFHGNFGKFQDIELIIEIAKRAHENNLPAQFLLVGEGEKEYLVKNVSLPNLRFIGKKTYKEVPNILSKCHLGMSFRVNNPLSVSSLPVKVFEYLGVGIPVLVTPISEAGQMVQEHNVGFQFDNSDIDALYGILADLIEDQKLYNSIVQNVMQQRVNYSRKEQAEKLVRLLDENFFGE